MFSLILTWLLYFVIVLKREWERERGQRAEQSNSSKTEQQQRESQTTQQH